jgi:hypothetical protein
VRGGYAKGGREGAEPAAGAAPRAFGEKGRKENRAPRARVRNATDARLESTREPSS